MYKLFIRRILFLFPPETVHHLVTASLAFLFKIPFIAQLIRRLYKVKHAQSVGLLGLEFPNRIGLAAGFDKNACSFEDLSNFGFGFIEIGTVTPKSQPGNPKPRSFRLTKDKALINRMGFNNLGVDSAVERLKNRPAGLIIGGNIGKNTATANSYAVKDYEYCFEKLYDYVDYFVVNVSCPNISDLRELQDQEMLEGILGRLTYLRASKSLKKPILLKISPDLNFQQVDETLEIVKSTGIDGIVATNTTISRDNLKTPSEKVADIGNGGLSGLPIRDRSTEMIRYIREKAGKDFPIIGVGGIMSVQDAREKIDAGADLLQIYTGFIYEGPGFVKRLVGGAG
ncbi:MAG: quinone-dependent dihydroorotate dehydrogenase [Bacteroidales bacterium]|nr:quinone-dependent dihydroorotate dehydrogenase [Bacteroidales bacterium]MCF8391732.1 quinone-dependent dihydroorotate dehydrogenase [Bacteroidales bacterium]